MTLIKIDFAPASLARRLNQQTLTNLVLACLLLGFTGSLAWNFWTIARQQNVLDDSIKTTQRQLIKLDANRNKITASPISPEKMKAVNRAIEQLNFPWNELFDALENATPATIAFLQIELDVPRGLLKATAETKLTEDMLAYVDELEHQGFFSTVVLSKHEVNEQDPNKPIRFQFEAHWRKGRAP